LLLFFFSLSFFFFHLSSQPFSECTYNHFNNSSTCPICNRTLGESDFMELIVADPTSTSAGVASKRNNYQSLFTKQNASSQSLAFQDMCARLLTQNDDLRNGTKFLMKQFLLESSTVGLRSGNMVRELTKLKEENTSLKQTHNSQRMRMEEALGELQKKLVLANKKLEEKDRQLMQFRKLHDTMTPQSPHQQHHHGHHGGGSSVGSNETPRRVSTSSGNGHQEPPLKGFIMQKEANERAKQRTLEQAQQRTPIFGGQPSHHHHQQQQQQHHHRSSSSRQQSYIGGGMMPHHQQIPQQRPFSADSGGSGASSQIRDLNSSSGYAFTGSDRGHPHPSQQQQQQQQQQQHIKRRRGKSPSDNVRAGSYPRAMSPSAAFTQQTQGGGRGPSSYFQQPGYGR
jgi:hypothetical protein